MASKAQLRSELTDVQNRIAGLRRRKREIEQELDRRREARRTTRDPEPIEQQEKAEENDG